MAPSGPLASRSRSNADMQAFWGRVEGACAAVPQTATSPIIRAVRRGLAHLKHLGCQTGSACVLVVHSDLQDTDELRGSKRSLVLLDNAGVRVVLCGFTKTREGGVKTDALLATWTGLFAEPVAVAPFCEGGF